MSHALRFGFLVVMLAGLFSCNREGTDVPPAAMGQVVAVDDAVAMAAGDSIVDIALLANDTWHQQCELSMTQLPQHGSARMLTPQAVLRYRPHAGFSGRDSLQYTLRLGQTQTSAWIKIAVPATACQPQPKADSTFTLMNEAVTLSVLGNDVLCPGAPSPTPVVVIAAQHGNATVQGNQIRYLPHAGYIGGDQFTYRLCATGDCPTARVQIDVRPNPGCSNLFQPRNDSINVYPGQIITIPKAQLIGNDVSCAGDISLATFALLSQPGYGTLVEYPTYITYHTTATPGTRDAFTYQVCLGSVQVCRSAQVVLRVR